MFVCLLDWKSCSYTDKMWDAKAKNYHYLPEENKSCVQILFLTSFGMSVKCESSHLRCEALILKQQGVCLESRATDLD